jgi:sugar/nucleoside kinase (ribokinase family)
MSPGRPIGDRPVDVVAIGSALVDVLAGADDGQLERLGLVKGSMKLVSEEESESLYSAMGPAVEVSGGSAANTAAGIASLGGASAYLARVAKDPLGEVFTHDIRAAGVAFGSPPATSGPATGRCLVFVSPDGERTMCTYLGAAAHLDRSYVDVPLLESARIVYLEGYLWDLEPAKDALRLACSVAARSGTLVALSLSDPFCVERHREEFLELATGGADLLFANEDEVKLLFATPDLDDALSELSRGVHIGAVTRGAHGSVVVADGEVVRVPAHPVPRVVDTTGAGDLYAAGFLTGLARGAGIEICAGIGSLAAAEVIGHMGSRPEVPLRRLAEEAGLAP